MTTAVSRFNCVCGHTKPNHGEDDRYGDKRDLDTGRTVRCRCTGFQPRPSLQR